MKKQRGAIDAASSKEHLMSSKELHGHVAIVTGATRKRGLGRAIALCLARAGADVVVTGSGTKPAGEIPRDERESNWRGATDVAEEVKAFNVLREGGRWEERLAVVPMGRPGTPEEVGELVRYLCGPHARWISGEVFLMTGGEVRRAAD